MPTCRNRDQVLAWYRAARGAGLRATIVNTSAYANAIVIGFRVYDQALNVWRREVRWRTLNVREGRVMEIRGLESRSEAEHFAISMFPAGSD